MNLVKKVWKPKWPIRKLYLRSWRRLSELFETELTIGDVMLRVLQKLKAKSQEIYTGSLTPEEVPLFESYYERVVERNSKMMGG